MRQSPHESAERNDERGITLVEVAIVGVLAAIVMLALTGFYINSQGNWIDSSAQAVTQRDATFILETLADSVHVASSAGVDLANHTLILFDVNSAERSRFWLESSDQLIHVGWTPPGVGSPFVDQGPLTTSHVNQFVLSKDDSMVYVSRLELQASGNQVVTMSMAATMFNRVIP